MIVGQPVAHEPARLENCNDEVFMDAERQAELTQIIRKQWSDRIAGTVDEVAALSNLTATTIRRAVQRGDLACFRTTNSKASSIRILASSVAAWLLRAPSEEAVGDE